MEPSQLAIGVAVRELPYLLTQLHVPRAARNELTRPHNPHLKNPRAGTALEPIHVFWAGPLGELQRFCLRSMAQQGHAVQLHVYDARHSELPSGVAPCDANQILPRELFQRVAGSAGVAAFADLFRYAVLHQRGGYWLDADVALVKPLRFTQEHLFSARWVGLQQAQCLSGAAMKAPRGSRHMKALQDFGLQMLLSGQHREPGALGASLITAYVLEPGREELLPSILPPTVLGAIDPSEHELLVKGGTEGFALLADERVCGLHLGAPQWSARKITLGDVPEESVAGHLRKLLGEGNPLTALADAHRSDKGTTYYGSPLAHNYTATYHALFRERSLEPLRILEIGLCRAREDKAQDEVPSLQMWKSYFPNAEIWGADLEDFSFAEGGRISIARFDQSSRPQLNAFISSAGRGGFDLIIEDGSHASAHQQISLARLFQAVRPGGLYVVEDLDWQPDALESPQVPKTKDVLRNFERTGRMESPILSPDESRFLEEHVASLRFFDSYIEVLNRGLQNGLAVLQRKDR